MPDVILPVLDEAEAIPWVLDRMPEGFRPIVVDNGSSDGSGQLARDLGAQVVVEDRRGFGAACHAGLVAARADTVCFMDCDASLDPQELPGLVSASDGPSELVVGARLAAKGAWPLHARTANRYLARRLNRRYHWTLTDPGPMRVVSREQLLSLGLTDRRSGWPLEMLVRAGEAGMRVVEVPVSYAPRMGRSKVTGTLAGTVRAVLDQRRQLATMRG